MSIKTFITHDNAFTSSVPQFVQWRSFLRFQVRFKDVSSQMTLTFSPVHSCTPHSISSFKQTQMRVKQFMHMILAFIHYKFDLQFDPRKQPLYETQDHKHFDQIFSHFVHEIKTLITH